MGLNMKLESNGYMIIKLIVSATFMGVETLVLLDSVKVDNTFYLLWYGYPWCMNLLKIKLGVNLGQTFISN